MTGAGGPRGAPEGIPVIAPFNAAQCCAVAGRGSSFDDFGLSRSHFAAASTSSDFPPCPSAPFLLPFAASGSPSGASCSCAPRASRGLPSESTSRQNRGIPLVNREPDALIVLLRDHVSISQSSEKTEPAARAPQSAIYLKIDAEISDIGPGTTPSGKTRAVRECHAFPPI